MKTVRVTTSQGRRYAVTFDETGEITNVYSEFRRGCDYGSQRRAIWHRMSGKPMTIAAACAGRAALKALGRN